MKKNILSTLLVGAAIATMGITSVQAGSLDTISGDVKFLFSGFDAAQATYDTTGLVDGATLCATVVACDAQSFTSNAPGANQSNDTWGLTIISSILPEPFGGVASWNSGDDGDFLVAYFHSFEDVRVDSAGGLGAFDADIFSIGGVVDIYRVTFAELNTINANDADQATLEAAITGLGLSTYLELTFQPGCSVLVPEATLCAGFNVDTLHGVSNGDALATGGDAQSKYQEIFDFEQTVTPCASPSCDGTSFNIRVNSGSALTTALPEPGALGLLGLGLVGMGLIARRRKA